MRPLPHFHRPQTARTAFRAFRFEYCRCGHGRVSHMDRGRVIWRSGWHHQGVSLTYLAALALEEGKVP